MKKYYAVYVCLMLAVFCAGSILGKDCRNFWELFTIILFVAVLTAAGCQDMKSMRISDKWHIAVIGIAGLSYMAVPELTVPSRMAGFLCVSVPFLVIALMIPGAFGGGDIKLVAAGGLFLGWKRMLVSAAIAILLGGGWTLCLVLSGKKRRKDIFAFGPFLCLGMAIGIFAGDFLAGWFAGC